MKPGDQHREDPRRAVALRYERSSGRAPSLVAKGEGAVAEQILRLARANDIPVHEDPELLRLLAQSEPPRAIPIELYGAVATLLAHLYRLDEECGAERESSEG